MAPDKLPLIRLVVLAVLLLFLLVLKWKPKPGIQLTSSTGFTSLLNTTQLCHPERSEGPAFFLSSGHGFSRAVNNPASAAEGHRPQSPIRSSHNLGHFLQFPSDVRRNFIPLYWCVEENMNTTWKGLAVLLLCVAAVKLYPDFARYMKIRSM
jgi:hypothetical protein